MNIQQVIAIHGSLDSAMECEDCRLVIDRLTIETFERLEQEAYLTHRSRLQAFVSSMEQAIDRFAQMVDAYVMATRP